MTLCDNCKETLPLSGDFVVCPLCARKLHFDCTTVTERSWRSMGSKRESWKCQFCRNAGENLGTNPLEVSSRPITPEVHANKRNRSEINSPQKEITGTIIGNLTTIDTKEFMTELKNMKAEIKGIADFCNFVSQKFDDINKNIEKNNTIMDTLINEIQALKNENKEKDECISSMQIQINKLEQQQLKNTIEIKNIPPTQNENLIEIVKAVGSSIKQEVTNADITDIYRTRTKNPEKSSIVATFSNTLTKTNYVKNARATRSVTTAVINQNIGSHAKVNPVSNNNIFVNNMLTNLNRQLLWQAKKKAREEGWKFVWENTGKIFARKEERAEVLLIQSTADISKIKRI